MKFVIEWPTQKSSNHKLEMKVCSFRVLVLIFLDKLDPQVNISRYVVFLYNHNIVVHKLFNDIHLYSCFCFEQKYAH